MVEEMMLLANCTVAERILAAFPACALLRRHAVPPPRQFEPLLRAAAACSLDLDASSSKVPAPKTAQRWHATPLNAGALDRSTLARLIAQRLHAGSLNACMLNCSMLAC